MQGQVPPRVRVHPRVRARRKFPQRKPAPVQGQVPPRVRVHPRARARPKLPQREPAPVQGQVPPRVRVLPRARACPKLPQRKPAPPPGPTDPHRPVFPRALFLPLKYFLFRERFLHQPPAFRDRQYLQRGRIPPPDRSSPVVCFRRNTWHTGCHPSGGYPWYPSCRVPPHRQTADNCLPGRQISGRDDFLRNRGNADRC